MPHLIIEHWQDIISLRVAACPLPPKVRDVLCCYIIEIADLVASLIWMVGSVCFFPSVSESVFISGCIMFVIGSFIFSGICTFTYLEAVSRSGFISFEAWENALYFGGSLIYLVGTVFYWPFTIEVAGTLLFIVGSFFFGMAAFCNGLNQRRFENTSHRMLVGTTSLYMAGSMMFIMGSVCFMPEMGGNDNLENMGAASFVVGSVLFVAGGIVSLVRTIMERGAPDASMLVSGSEGWKEENINNET